MPHAGCEICARTFDFTFNSVGATINVDEVVLNVLYVPFDYDGNAPG